VTPGGGRMRKKVNEMLGIRSAEARTAWSATRSLVVVGFVALGVLAARDPSLARPPAQPGGPVAPSRGTAQSAAGLALAVIPPAAYAAAVALIFGGAALFSVVGRRRDAKERWELMGQREIELLGEHAAALAALYERYSQRFLVARPLWGSLAADEMKHSRWVGECADRIRRGEGSLRRELFPYGRVSNALDQVRQLARDAARVDLTEATALRNALAQERERAEWRLPDLFAVSSGKFGTVLALLESEAQAHQRAISGAIDGG